MKTIINIYMATVITWLASIWEWYINNGQHNFLIICTSITTFLAVIYSVQKVRRQHFENKLIKQQLKIKEHEK